MRAEAFTSTTTGWVFLALTLAPHVRPWPSAKRQPSLLGGPKGGALCVFMIVTVAAASSLLSPFGWCCLPSVPAVSPPLLRVLGTGMALRCWSGTAPLSVLGARAALASDRWEKASLLCLTLGQQSISAHRDPHEKRSFIFYLQDLFLLQ